MFDSLLIANRGEIASRIQRACRALGVRDIVIFSEADRAASYVETAGAAICIGPAPARQSYLNMAAILSAAAATGAGAIHPGYGFLSENPRFAQLVEDVGLTFVGPRPETIRIMGDKIAARAAMTEAGVPCVPGSESALGADDGAIVRTARDIGYPVILKAAAGGGGRGMRVVRDEEHLLAAVAITRAEARSAFGDDNVYMERFLDHPRHIEIQVLADNYGAAVWLGARDCSLQRRHQKVIEEAPPPGIDPARIAEIGERCAEACRRLGYRGAGTFEFLYQDGAFAFIEMNTRIQVEHPVTEMVTGVDIVEAQIRIARGEPLGLDQSGIRQRGHAVECRINAEEPGAFLPSPGRVTEWLAPRGPGIRIDSHMRPGADVPAYYDSLIGKLIAHGATREEALARMAAALDDMIVSGVQTNLPLHRALMGSEAFVAGGPDIHFLERWLGERQVAP